MASARAEPCSWAPSTPVSLLSVSEWAYAGVNHSIAGNGGPECAQFVPGVRRIWETLLAVVWASTMVVWSYRRVQVPPAPRVVREDRGGKRCMLVLLCMVFGIEVGFKFSTRTVIYILNPCHVITMLQVGCKCEWFSFAVLRFLACVRQSMVCSMALYSCSVFDFVCNMTVLFVWPSWHHHAAFSCFPARVNIV